MSINQARLGSAFLLLWLSTAGRTDGTVVDKVYHPYVEPLEWELEWRMSHEDENPADDKRARQLHKLGLGKALSDYVFAEFYLLADHTSEQGLNLEAYEIEVLWQLSEQGEYSLDYGLLFELEKTHKENAWEAATSLLLEKELGRFSTTANLSFIYEWGKRVADEFETALSLQARYRYLPALEPALELYLGESTRAVGPVLLGMQRLGVAKALRWELGLVLGLDNDTADYTFRAVLEYEF